MHTLRNIIFRERKVYYFIPAIIVLGILAVYPLFNNIWLSFTNGKGIGTFSNYSRLFNDKRFWGSLFTTGKWLIVTVAGELIIGLLLATLMNMKLRATKFFRTVLIIPWMTPMIAVCTIWAWMYNGDFGILNYFFNKIFGTNVLFLSDTSMTVFWLGVVYIWKRSSFSMLMFLSGLQGISEDIFEACKIDGASWWVQLVKVKLPLMFPVLRSLLLLSVITSLNQFTIAYSITAGGPARSTELIQLYIYNVGIAGFQYNYGAAASSMFLIIVLILAVIYIYATENAEEEIF